MNPGAKHSQLRPRIGVFVNNKFVRKIPLFARKLTQANQQAKCSIYFFTLQDIDWKRQTINGYVLKDENKHWLKRRLPFPDIIYDRGTGFVGEEKAEVEALRSRFKKKLGIKYINNCKLKKWQVHQKLSRYKAVNKYLPKTTLSRGVDDIRAMVAKYKNLFLKSSSGSGGKGVFSLEKCADGFYFRYYHKGTHLKRYASNLEDLCTSMKTIGLKPDRVIIQEGIRLIQYKNRPMDLRVLMVKDKGGIWNAVYNQARVAKKGAVITNISLGGEVMNYSDIFAAIKKKYPGIPSDKQVKKICKIISYYIEKEFGPFGEIGIDVAVDKTGKVWLLEANSKPSKLPERGIENTLGISPQFLMTLEYAKLLYLNMRTEAEREIVGKSSN